MHRNRTRTHDPLPTFDPTRLRRQLPKYYGRSIDHIGWLEVDLSLRSSIAVDKAAQGCSFAIHTAATANVSSRRSRMSTCDPQQSFEVPQSSPSQAAPHSLSNLFAGRHGRSISASGAGGKQHPSHSLTSPYHVNIIKTTPLLPNTSNATREPRTSERL
jgi:hypothetical protein